MCPGKIRAGRCFGRPAQLLCACPQAAEAVAPRNAPEREGGEVVGRVEVGKVMAVAPGRAAEREGREVVGRIEVGKVMRWRSRQAEHRGEREGRW